MLPCTEIYGICICEYTLHRRKNCARGSYNKMQSPIKPLFWNTLFTSKEIFPLILFPFPCQIPAPMAWALFPSPHGWCNHIGVHHKSLNTDFCELQMEHLQCSPKHVYSQGSPTELKKIYSLVSVFWIAAFTRDLGKGFIEHHSSTIRCVSLDVGIIV